MKFIRRLMDAFARPETYMVSAGSQFGTPFWTMTLRARSHEEAVRLAGAGRYYTAFCVVRKL